MERQFADKAAWNLFKPMCTVSDETLQVQEAQLNSGRSVSRQIKLSADSYTTTGKHDPGLLSTERIHALGSLWQTRLHVLVTAGSENYGCHQGCSGSLNILPEP